jgi:hypothetical protein
MLSDELQTGIVPDVGQLLAEIGEGRKAVPGTEQVIGGGGEEPRSVDGLAPIRPADLGDRLPIREQAKVPGAAETYEEIDALGQRAEALRDIRIRVERTVNP